MVLYIPHLFHTIFNYKNVLLWPANEVCFSLFEYSLKTKENRQSGHRTSKCSMKISRKMNLKINFWIKSVWSSYLYYFTFYGWPTGKLLIQQPLYKYLIFLKSLLKRIIVLNFVECENLCTNIHVSEKIPLFVHSGKRAVFGDGVKNLIFTLSW